MIIYTMAAYFVVFNKSCSYFLKNINKPMDVFHKPLILPFFTIIPLYTIVAVRCLVFASFSNIYMCILLSI